MDLTMDIAAMSVDMHTAKTQQSLGVATLNMAMDAVDESMGELLGNLDPNVGTSVNILA